MAIAEYFAALKVDTKGAIKSIDKFDKRASEIDSRIKKIGVSIQRSLESVRLPAALITGAGLTFGKGLINEASDLKESINAVQVVAGGAAEEILNFGKNAATTVGLSQAEFNQLSVGVAGLLKSSEQFSDTEVASLTKQLAVAAADAASVNNTTVQDSFSAINQAIRGETEALRKYQGDVTDASLTQFALAEGIAKSVKEMTFQEKTALRAKKALSDLAKFQGDFANTSGETANQQRIQAAQANDLSASYGSNLLPAYQAIQRVTGSIINAFAGLSDETQGVIVKFGLLATAVAGVTFAASFVAPAFLAITGPIGIAVGALVLGSAFIISNWEAVKAFFIGFATGVQKALKPLSDVGQSVIDALKPLTSFLGGLFKPLIENIMPAKQGFEGLTKAGQVFGEVVGGAIRILFSPLELLIKLINKVVGAFRLIKVPDSIKRFFGSGSPAVSQRIQATVQSQPVGGPGGNVSNTTINNNMNVQTSDPVKAANRVVDMTNRQFGS